MTLNSNIQEKASQHGIEGSGLKKSHKIYLLPLIYQAVTIGLHLKHVYCDYSNKTIQLSISIFRGDEAFIRA